MLGGIASQLGDGLLRMIPGVWKCKSGMRGDDTHDSRHRRNTGGGIGTGGVRGSGAIRVGVGGRGVGVGGQGERRTQWEGWDVIVFDSNDEHYHYRDDDRKCGRRAEQERLLRSSRGS